MYTYDSVLRPFPELLLPWLEVSMISGIGVSPTVGQPDVQSVISEDVS